MSLGMMTMKSTVHSWNERHSWNEWHSWNELTILEKMEQLREKIENVEAVVIGAGAGISASAGFTYSGDRFWQYFSDFLDIHPAP